jgi:hypothetical protein
MKCGAFSLVGIEGARCGVYPMRCKKWGCPVCGPRRVKATMARTKAGMSLGTCRFFTLTSPGTEDGDTSYENFPERWKRFRMRVERRWGRIEYIAVVERQKRGAAHVHVVYRGPFIPQQWLSRVAAECGFGRVADIRRSNPKLMRYLAKYLTKELSDPSAAPPRYFRRVRWSRGWCVWEKRSRAVPWNDWWILDTPSANAATEAARHGYKVEEVVADEHRNRFERHWAVRWMRDMIGYRPVSPLLPSAAWES